MNDMFDPSWVGETVQVKSKRVHIYSVELFARMQVIWTTNNEK